MDSIEQDILTILQGLKSSGPAYISDLLLGFQRYPSSGTDDHNRIVQLEVELINRGLVIVAEQGGANKTQDGYYLFRISPSGISYLQSAASRSSSSESPNRRPKYALSTQSNDNALANEGLHNVGLLGFLEREQKEGTFPLQHFYLTFSKGDDHFYTLDVSRERFENRDPIELPSLGFARKAAYPDYHLLYRYFDNDLHNHVYVTSPALDKISRLNVRHEYKDNPIYIRRTSSPDSIPLYLYSSRRVDFFYPLNDDINDSESDDGSEIDGGDDANFFPENLREEIESILREQNLELTLFSFVEDSTPDGEKSLTVGLKNSVYSFHVNLQIGQKYFTVRRSSEADDKNSFVTHIEQWSEVVSRFRAWIDDIRETLASSSASEERPEFEDPVQVSESLDVNLNKQVHAHFDYAIRDSQDIDPALGVEKLAGQVAKIINNLKAEPGNMAGVFAQWGRGKTRLMNEIWKCLQTADTKFEYKLVRYQAWRYQHTPASWAYLYEQFSLAYLGKKNTLRNFFGYNYRLFRLNLRRDGWLNLLTSIVFFSLVVWGVWEGVRAIWKIDLSYPVIIPFALIPVLGATISVVVKNLRSDYLTKAISLIKKYMEKVSFNEALGVQAEIQKELVHLMNAWIKIKEQKNESQKETNRLKKFYIWLLGIFTSIKRQKKVLLFVDDLDRCTEEKVIEIIDSLRIMLDDEELKEKLIVLTAVDERMLRVAIENKFSYVVESTSNGGDAQTMEKQRRDLTKEYIDKLFIFSLKLGPLDADESGDIFDKIVKDQFVRDAAPVTDNTNQSESSGATIKSPVVEQGANNPVEEIERSSQPKQDTISITTEKLEKPPERHIKLFKSKLRLVSNSTPRKLRILFYRYLFARNLLIQHQSDDGNNYWLEGEAHGLFIERLIHFSQEDIKEISEEKRRMYLPARETNLSLENGSAVPASEYKALLDIFETTIAY